MDIIKQWMLAKVAFSIAFLIAFSIKKLTAIVKDNNLKKYKHKKYLYLYLIILFSFKWLKSFCCVDPSYDMSNC